MYFFNLKKAFLILTLLVVPIFLITLERRQLENMFLFRFLLYFSGQVQVGSQALSDSITHTVTHYTTLLQIKKQNKLLLRKNRRLQAQVFVLEELRQENSRLKKILQFSPTRLGQFIFAQVSGRDPLSQYQLITINRGEQDGVRTKMSVISENGFVGYVFRVTKSFSHIILVTDPHAVVEAIVQRSRVRGILEGAGRGVARLKYLKRRDDIKVGDVVVTTRSDPGVAGGFPIGMVTKITKVTYGLTQKVTITPFINPSQLEEVLIVKHKTIATTKALIKQAKDDIW